MLFWDPVTLIASSVALIILAICIRVTLPRRAVKEPSCEKCKYPVRGLTGLTCPECGADLRTWGIITARMEARRRGGLFSALAAWTIIAAAVSLVAWALVE